MKGRSYRIFKNKWFSRFARKEGIVDADLCAAISNVEKGLIEADLGGGVVKQRIARAQEGKSGIYRSLKIGAIVEVKCDEKTVSK